MATLEELHKQIIELGAQIGKLRQDIDRVLRPPISSSPLLSPSPLPPLPEPWDPLDTDVYGHSAAPLAFGEMGQYEPEPSRIKIRLNPHRSIRIDRIEWARVGKQVVAETDVPPNAVQMWIPHQYQYYRFHQEGVGWSSWREPSKLRDTLAHGYFHTPGAG